MEAVVSFDGACTGNPGPMGAGAVIEMAGRRFVVSVPLGRGTNNEAEYQGLIIGLERALAEGATRVHVRGDSQLVLRQLEGAYTVRAANLRPLYEKARALLTRFAGVQLEWVRREANAEADRAARDAIGPPRTL